MRRWPLKLAVLSLLLLFPAFWPAAAVRVELHSTSVTQAADWTPLAGAVDSQRVWYAAAATPPVRVTLPRPKPARSGTVSAAATAPSGLEPCGGDLPPCWVKQRESRGNYQAYNPTGCAWTDKQGVTHRGCWGAWQFGSMWAGKLGLPADLSTATPAQQDEAARQLWAGGSGCSNWAAC